MRAIIVGICPLLMAGLLFSCGQTAKQVREHTYPPEVVYIADAQIKEAMVSMDNGIMVIEAAKYDPYPTVMVVDALNDMRRASISLAVPETRMLVPPIDANMGRLIRDIDEALLASTRNRPSHARAQALPGSCLYCHHRQVATSN